MDDHEQIEKFCDLPFAAEYAKSNRSTCKGCRQAITQGVLRMSACEPSRFFDGVQNNWYADRNDWFHFHCFWSKLKPSKDQINETSIRGMDWLKWDDQERIREKIVAFNAKKESTQPDVDNIKEHFNSYKAEHSRSNRGKCYKCKENFKLSEVKIGRHGAFYHPLCIVPDDGSVQLRGKISDVQRFDNLSDEGKAELRKAWDKIEWKPPGANQAKNTKDAVNAAAAAEGAASQLSTLVESIFSPDAMKKGARDSVSSGVKLDVDVKTEKVDDSGVKTEEIDVKIALTEEKWSVKDEKEAGNVPEVPFKRARFAKTEAQILMEKLKKQSDHLWEVREALGQLSRKQLSALLEANNQQLPTEEHKMIDRLSDCAVFGRPIQCPKCPSGQIVYSTSKKSYVCLGYLTEYTKCTYNSPNPLRTPFQIPLHMVEALPILKTIKINSLSKRVYPACDQPVVDRSPSFRSLGARKINNLAAEVYDGQKKGHYHCASSGKQIVKNGTVVDKECEYAEHCHVYKDDEGVLYSCVLTSADMACNKNSYYKIQLLCHDQDPNIFYVFRSWGRVGTDVGGSRTQHFYKNQGNAIQEFKDLFCEKTGNKWDDRKYFKKRPGKMGMVDTDYSELIEEQDQTKTIVPGSKTKLPKPVKDVIMKIFDVNSMRAQMKQFELDLEKMPLGKLSKKQIHSAYSVLKELEELLDNLAFDFHDRIIDISNRFYTLIPHNFGMNPMEILNTKDLVKKKSKMLDSLMEIEIAYSIINENAMNKIAIAEGKDPVDAHYESIKCDIQPMDPDSDEYIRLARYLAQSHGSTHHWDIKLVDILKVERHSERANFCADIGNRMLLWHGSGLTNFGGILSQGLKIAPPEAPVSGYMFGKGVYFADMASKSFNYCRVPRPGEEGLMLLCEVALGTPRYEYHATNHSHSSMQRLNTHSVKGIGREYPDEAGAFYHPDGYVIPMGPKKIIPPTDPTTKNYSLIYNEYIVYDTAQINLRYLLRVRWGGGSGRV